MISRLGLGLPHPRFLYTVYSGGVYKYLPDDNILQMTE